MSREIYINFDTVFWTSINWKDIFIYVTKLKSRIYKATSQKIYFKILFLQRKLILSLSARYLASKLLFSCHEYNTYKSLYDPEHVSFIEQFDVHKYVTLNLNISQINRNISSISSYCQNLLDLLVVFILKPYLDGCILKNSFLFYVELSENKVQSIRKKMLYKIQQNYSVQKIDLANFIYGVNTDYILTRFPATHLIQLILHRCFNQSVLKKYIPSLKSLNRFHQSIECSLPMLICELVKYYLMLEVLYLLKLWISNTDDRFDNFDTLQVLSYNTEIVIFHKEKKFIHLINYIVGYLVNYKTYSNRMLFLQASASVIHGFTFMDYFIILQQNNKITIKPSKKSLLELLDEVTLVFDKTKGDTIQHLISRLNYLLVQWMYYFFNTKDYKTFALIDYLIYLKLRAWIFRYHKSWSKINQKYFFVLNDVSLQSFYRYSSWFFKNIQSNVRAKRLQKLFLFKLRTCDNTNKLYGRLKI